MGKSMSLHVERTLRIAALGLLLAMGSVTHAQDKAGPAQIFTYGGADREQRLLKGAQEEGTVVVYTSLNVKDSGPIVEAFEKKYAAQKIKVVLWRASGEKVVQRALAEARGKRFTPDVFESDGIEMEILAREKLLSQFNSPSFKELPPQAFPPHKLYVADRFNFFTIAYNTKLVKPEDVPNTYQDLLAPKWMGKVALETSDDDWFMAMVKSMGEKEGLAYFYKLAEQKPQVRTGHTLIAELVAAGEIPLAAAVYNHAVERLARNGAPIKWKALAPTMGRPGGIGLARNAPHPHAAMLFADFLLSREGQELVRARDRVPANTEVETPLNRFKYEVINPSVVLDENEKWSKLYEDIFVKHSK
jgi:iron(III) transport system substrate-binding protein